MGQVSKVAKRYAAVVVAALALVAALVAGGTAFNTPRAYAADVHVSTQDELQQAIYNAGSTPTTIIVDANITTDGNNPAWFKEHQGTVPVQSWTENGNDDVDLVSMPISRNERYAFKVGSDAEGDPVQQDITILPAAGSGQITFTDSNASSDDWWSKITGAFRVENNSKLTVGNGANDPCNAPADTFMFTGFNTTGNGGNGAVFNVQEGSELVLNHATLSWNGVYDNFGGGTTPQMFNSELSRGATIYPSGGAIYGAPGSSITINGGSINNNHASWNGGAISIGTATTETIVGSEGTLWDTSTKATSSFAWTNTSQQASTLVINGTSITNNDANNSGGAIYLGPNVNAQITSAHIDGNTAKGADVDGEGAPQDILYFTGRDGQLYKPETAGHVGGGGLFVNSGSKVALLASTVDNNTAVNAKMGGGIAASGASIVSIDSTSISGNENQTDPLKEGTAGAWGKGGGIGVFDVRIAPNDGYLAMNSGTIANNKSLSQGGGIYIDPNTTMYVNNGYVTGNTAGIAGGGIAYCYFGSTDAINNAYAAVFDNKTGTGLGQDLSVPNNIDSEGVDSGAGGVVLNGSVYGRDGAVTWLHDGDMTADASESFAFGYSHSPTPGKKDVLSVNDFETNGDGVQVLKRSEYQILRAELDPAAEDFIEANKQVIITGNSSGNYGGGLAINGRMHFNTSPISVEKKWTDEDGNAITWPEGAEVKLTVQKVTYAQPVQGCDAGQAASSDATPTDVAADPKILKVNPDTNKVAVYDEKGNLISDDPLAVWENLPYVSPTEGYYTVKEDVTGMPSGQEYTQEFEGNAYTTLALSNVAGPEEEKPELEKYVNQDVHQEVEVNKPFTYDIIAYATKDATKLTITDNLVKNLVYTSAATDVKVVDLGEENNHKTNSDYTGTNADATVAQAGTPVEAEVTISADKKVLEVVVSDVDKKDLQGHYIKVTVQAQIPDTAEYAKIPGNKNGTVKSTKEHKGIENTASYSIDTDKENAYSSDSNTVTVKPKGPNAEIDLLVTKILRNKTTGAEETPAAGAFTFKLELTDPNGTKSNLEATNTENGGKQARFKLAELDTPGEYTYKVTEVAGSDSTITYDTSELSGSFFVAEFKMPKPVAAAQALSTRINIANPFAFAITPFAASADATDVYDTYLAVVDKETYEQYNGVAQIESTDDINSVKLAELSVGSFTNEVTPDKPDEPKPDEPKPEEPKPEEPKPDNPKPENPTPGDNPQPEETLSAEASTVTKTWADGGNDKDRDDVEFQLYRKVGDGAWEIVQGKTVTLTSEDSDGLTTWTGRFDNLPAYEGGEKISYRAVEANSADFEGLYTPDSDEEIIIVDVDSISGMGATNHPFTPNTSVDISKQEVGGGPELPGATLIVRDAAGNEIERWVSGTEPHKLTLEPGVYTLTEVTAPNGYDVAETMTFRVNVDGTIELLQNGEWLSVEDHIVMFDAPTTPGKPDNPKTPTPGKPSNPGTPTTSKTPTPTSSARTADAVGGVTIALLFAALLGAGGMAYTGSRSRTSRKK